MSFIPGQMAIQVVSGLLNKVPVNAEILSFEPPVLKPKTVSVKGGRYVESSMVVGFEEMTFTLKLSGAIDLMLLAFESGDSIEIISSAVLENGTPVPASHYMRVKHFTASQSSVTAGELSEYTIEGSLSEYKYKVAAKEVHSVNTDTLEFKHFGKDLTGKAVASMAVGAFSAI